MYEIRLAIAAPAPYTWTLAFIPQIQPIRIDLRRYHFIHGKLFSLANFLVGKIDSLKIANLGQNMTIDDELLSER